MIFWLFHQGVNKMPPLFFSLVSRDNMSKVEALYLGQIDPVGYEILNPVFVVLEGEV